MFDTHFVLLITVIALVTICLRFIPFLIFRGNRKTPVFIAYLGNVLPYAIMGMLVIYCLRNISFNSSPFCIPEIIASIVVVLLHIWKRNSLLSIMAGTLCYMLLVQVVF